jgi:hypothetical protein
MARLTSQHFTSASVLAVLLFATIADYAVADSKILQVQIKIERKRVIIPTSINGSRKLNLIFDSGMGFDGVYLFHKILAEEIDTAGAIEVRVPGAGSGEASTAVMIENGRLTFGDVTVDSQRVIISNSPNTQGFDSDGVIGWNLLGHYAVEIDYDHEMILLHDPAEFQADTTWQHIPITLKKNIPFLEGTVEVVDSESVPIILYIDLGSDEALELLIRPDQKFTLPDSLKSSYIGTGLSGDIHGQYGRSKRLRVAGCDLFDIPTAFVPAEMRSKQEGADGILGNDCIRRFNIIFDYAHERLYVKPNSIFGTPFDTLQQQ